MPLGNKPSGSYVHHLESYYERNLVTRNFVKRGLTTKALGYLKTIISVTSFESCSLGSYRSSFSSIRVGGVLKRSEIHPIRNLKGNAVTGAWSFWDFERWDLMEQRGR